MPYFNSVLVGCCPLTLPCAPARAGAGHHAAGAGHRRVCARAAAGAAQAGRARPAASAAAARVIRRRAVAGRARARRVGCRPQARDVVCTVRRLAGSGSFVMSSTRRTAVLWPRRAPSRPERAADVQPRLRSDTSADSRSSAGRPARRAAAPPPAAAAPLRRKSSPLSVTSAPAARLAASLVATGGRSCGGPAHGPCCAPSAVCSPVRACSCPSPRRPAAAGRQCAGRKPGAARRPPACRPARASGSLRRRLPAAWRAAVLTLLTCAGCARLTLPCTLGPRRRAPALQLGERPERGGAAPAGERAPGVARRPGPRPLRRLCRQRPRARHLARAARPRCPAARPRAARLVCPPCRKLDPARGGRRHAQQPRLSCCQSASRRQFASHTLRFCLVMAAAAPSRHARQGPARPPCAGRTQQRSCCACR